MFFNNFPYFIFDFLIFILIFLNPYRIVVRNQFLLLYNPFPEPRSVIILNNAKIYYYTELKKIYNNKKIYLEYLLSYSFNFNLIETLFLLLKI